MSRQIFILNFHGLGTPRQGLSPGERDCWISLKFFGEILDLIRNRKDVQITFDDSNETDHSLALPLLRAGNVVARFFVVAGRIGQGGYLTEHQLVSLAEAGMGFGSHGMYHRPWAGLDAPNLKEELVEAKSRLEQVLQTPVNEAACPFGSYNRRVLGMLRRTGYGRVYTSDRGPARSDAWIQPRNTIMQKHNLSDISRMLAPQPPGLPQLWRRLKLLIKRVR